MPTLTFALVILVTPMVPGAEMAPTMASTGPMTAPAAMAPTDPMTAGEPMVTAMAPDDAPGGTPPTDEDVAATDEAAYRPVRLQVSGLVWYDPGQRGLIEAHPLVMGLAAMALATVTLLFFFLRGVKRPRDGDR